MTQEKTALIIEDEKEIRDIYVDYCEFFNIFKEIYVAGTVEEARQIIQVKTPDIIYLDLGLGGGGLDGKDILLPEMRTILPNGKIIVLSAYNEYKNECIEKGADVFIEKPISVKEFRAAAEDNQIC
ncbi:MAG: response regulator [Candidatus Omnitrophica bacterium]|nr:response regulator [Candidatus Omnitrophota bacterium]